VKPTEDEVEEVHQPNLVVGIYGNLVFGQEKPVSKKAKITVPGTKAKPGGSGSRTSKAQVKPTEEDEEDVEDDPYGVTLACVLISPAPRHKTVISPIHKISLNTCIKRIPQVAILRMQCSSA
jgi:hypothetical protein